MNRIRLKLNGKWFENFSTMNVNLRIDTIASQFSFTGFSEFFRILKYDDCQVYFDDDLIITGTVLNPVFKYTKKPTLIAISGYSKTGILEDVSIPLALYPLQYDGLSLAQIARKITSYFNLRLKIFDNAVQLSNLPFEKVSSSPGDSPKSFLSRLCNQRGLVLTHDNFGRLLIYRVMAEVAPAGSYIESDTLNYDFAPNAQGIHSQVTVMRQSKKDDDNIQQLTKSSPFIKNIDRPIITTLSDGEELEENLNKLICAEARNFSLKLTFEGFLNLRAGFYINFESPILKRKTKFIIESVEFKANKKEKTTDLKLVLPCVYTGILPSSTPFV